MLYKGVIYAPAEENGGNNTFHRFMESSVSVVNSYRTIISRPVTQDTGET